MAGRRGARSGRGWDAIPPRPTADESPDAELGPDDSERGNGAGRRRFGSSGGSSSGAFGASGSRAFGSGSRSAAGRRLASRGDRTDDRGDRGDRAEARDGHTEARDGHTEAGGGRAGDSDGHAGDLDGRAGDRGRGAWEDDGLTDSRGKGAGGRWRAGSGGRGGKGATERPPEPPRSESEVARDICLRQLAVRPRTRAELAKVLARKEISEEVIAEVLDRYDEVGIIDDAAFARMWVSTRHQGRGLARRALANELRQHGVESEVATEALETLDDEAEATTARALVDRKLRSARGTPDQVFRRLVGMLARKGYPAGVAIQAVKEALAARDEEAAEFADQIDADALADEATDSLS
ncbi:hypothetical protein GCM10020358_14690 [Amorphoplanes nipponensis]|uniref:Regulatory protein RecX n=1 Tax=Actinoplanes nipponensis TaxID=135950 RepID=A0A919JLI8_9ACTN|nr:hypothetical protein Ani05nite_67680 [Actinoplanes nipponensis]